MSNKRKALLDTIAGAARVARDSGNVRALETAMNAHGAVAAAPDTVEVRMPLGVAKAA
jgi:hypothetical protein